MWTASEGGLTTYKTTNPGQEIHGPADKLENTSDVDKGKQALPSRVFKYNDGGHSQFLEELGKGLFDRNALCEVSRLVHVLTTHQSGVVRKQLERD